MEDVQQSIHEVIKFRGIIDKNFCREPDKILVSKKGF